jgi:predicted dehydrogenase
VRTAAVIGTGFIGGVHLETLRRIGVRVAGVLGSSPERAAARPARSASTTSTRTWTRCAPTTPWTSST